MFAHLHVDFDVHDPGHFDSYRKRVHSKPPAFDMPKRRRCALPLPAEEQGALDCVNHASELCQDAVSSGVDHASTKLAD